MYISSTTLYIFHLSSTTHIKFIWKEKNLSQIVSCNFFNYLIISCTDQEPKQSMPSFNHLPYEKFHNNDMQATSISNKIKGKTSNIQIHQLVTITVLLLTSSEDLSFLSIPLDIESHERAVTMQANNPNSSPTPSCSPYFCTSFRSAFKMLNQNLLYVTLKSLVKFWNKSNYLFIIWLIQCYLIITTSSLMMNSIMTTIFLILTSSH